MSNELELTLACGDYESIRALKEGTVACDGARLNVLTDMDSSLRHWRMLRGREFDVCELSLSSYLVARDQSSCTGGSATGSSSSTPPPASASPRT